MQRYRVVFDALFRDIPSIPTGRFHEVAFADLERDPIGQMEKCRAALNLGAFEDVRPQLTRYVASLRGYEKTSFSPLDPTTRERVNIAAVRCLERWGYAP